MARSSVFNFIELFQMCNHYILVPTFIIFLYVPLKHRFPSFLIEKIITFNGDLYQHSFMWYIRDIHGSNWL